MVDCQSTHHSFGFFLVSVSMAPCGVKDHTHRVLGVVEYT